MYDYSMMWVALWLLESLSVKLLPLVRNALKTLESTDPLGLAGIGHSSVKIEALIDISCIFQAAKIGARRYRNDETLIIILLLTRCS